MHTLKRDSFRILLAGNPNSGKTSIFNALTGASQRVGNYPGITVESREGHYRHQNQQFNVIDLPGTYSLSSHSPEEKVAQIELVNSKPDALVIVVDSTVLKRSFTFVAQLLQLRLPAILCLNMADEALEAGQKLNLDLLRKKLGFPVIETIGHRKQGIEELKNEIANLLANGDPNINHSMGDDLDRAIEELKETLEYCKTINTRSRDWIASRLLANDKEVRDWLLAEGDEGRQALSLSAKLRQKIEEKFDSDMPMLLMQGYHQIANTILDSVIKNEARPDARRLSDSIDKIVVNRVLGLPIFFALMYGVFWLTFRVGETPMGWIEEGVNGLASYISSLWPQGSQSALRSLIVDGIISGVGGILVFLPNIVLLFFCLSLMENSGYMTRAAFLMDRLMHRFGLHGRSFMPLVTGFGCSIPGIMATRTMENEKDRLATMFVLPLMSCGARLAVWMLLVPAFFSPVWRAPVLWGIYFVGILLALVLALILRHSVLKGDPSPFVMELPPYRFPTLRTVLGQIAERAWLYLRKAGTVILAFSIVLWVLSSYPKPSSYKIDEQIKKGSVLVVKKESEKISKKNKKYPEVLSEKEIDLRRKHEENQSSIAALIGNILEPVLKPLGLNERIGIAIVGAFAAKEVVVSQLAISYSLDHESDKDADSLRTALRSDLSPLAGISLILFLLIATPCMATVAVMKRETGSWRWPLLQFFGLTLLGYLIALVVYQIGSRLV